MGKKAEKENKSSALDSSLKDDSDSFTYEEIMRERGYPRGSYSVGDCE